MELAPILFSIGCALTGMSLGFLCHMAKVPIWVGALLLGGIFLLVQFHS